MSKIHHASVLLPVGADRKYIGYIDQLAVQEVVNVASPQAFCDAIRVSQEGVSFISQSYLEKSETWDDIHPIVSEARSRHVPIFALLNGDCQPILLARAFDYGFHEVIKLDQPDHEANARIRSAYKTCEDARALAQNQLVDAETDLYLSSAVENHLIAARGYAKRHHTGIYGVVMNLKFTGNLPGQSAPRDMKREIIRFASALKQTARPYDPIFRLDVTRFMILTFDTESKHIVEMTSRIANMLNSQVDLDSIGAEMQYELYHFPVESDLGIEELLPVPLI